MIVSISKLYEGESLERVTLGVMFFRATTSGTIKNIYLYCGGNIAIGQAYFNLRINGVTQWTGENRLIIGASAASVSKTDLNISVSRGDILYLDLEAPPQSGVPSPIALIIETGDGTGSSSSADEITVDDSGFVVITGTDAQAALDSIDTELDALADDILDKQDELISGTNIKTINGVSVLGSGDISTIEIPQNSQSAAYTLVLSDAGKHIFHPSADTTARTFTIPANSSVAFPVGTTVTFINQNAAGIITIAITTDTLRFAGVGTTGSRTLAANGIATAIKITSTIWLINGTGLT